MSEKYDNAVKEFNDCFQQIKDRLNDGAGHEKEMPWSFYVIKYLPIPLAKIVLLLRGFFICQVKLFWYGREKYEIMLNKEMAKLIQMETQMAKEEKKKNV